MKITIETITRDQRSILLYAEHCAVEQGGLLDGVRLNAADLGALVQLEDAGILAHGRIPGRLLGSFKDHRIQPTHSCDLTDTGWELAALLRRERSVRPNKARKQVDAVLDEQEGKVAGPFPAGYVEPRTGRVAVLVKDYADSILNGEKPAYWFGREADAMGLDPWRLVDGVDPLTAGGSWDVWFASGKPLRVGPGMTFFMSEEHAGMLGVEPNPMILAPEAG